MLLPQYECDCCGACCRGHLIVEAYDLDVLREPRLATADGCRQGWTPERVMADLEQDGRALTIAGSKPCPFLAADNRCGIYPTRPNVCVAMQAGDPQCRAARKAAELPPLQPKVVPQGWRQPLKRGSIRCPICGSQADLAGKTPEDVFALGVTCPGCGEDIHPEVCDLLRSAEDP